MISSSSFDHVYFTNSASVKWKNHETLHIYIEGDGTPWIAGKWIAKDPTPRSAVMLELMNLDDSPAILLGRPCYHLSDENSKCEPEDWTVARYSANIVNSMIDAMATLQRKFDFSRVSLFGHSGGGVIATLMANLIDPRLPPIAAVVTIGANLDIDVWTTEHGFLPLDKSINPASLPPSPSSTFQLHLFGNQDSVVDHGLLTDYFANRPNVESKIYDGFDHTCCWVSIWPEILDSVK